jgi:hypothetical protein
MAVGPSPRKADGKEELNMAANFYDNSGMMAGCDIHKYIPIGPPPLFSGPPIPAHPHIVFAPFLQPTATFWKRTGTVKSGNWQMIQGSFDIYFVLHVPWLVPPPGLLEAIEIETVFKGSGSKAQLTAHSVTGEGSALATCIVSAFGLNLNCQDLGISAPTGIVLNINSVETSPTAGDYVGAYVGMCVDNAIGFLLDKIPTKDKKWRENAKEVVKHIWRRIGDIPIAKALDIPSKAQEIVQDLVDNKVPAVIKTLKTKAKGVV